MSEWVKKYPITSFIILTFGFSYLVGGVFNIWLTPFTAKFPDLVSLYLPSLLVVLGPSFGAIVVSYLTDGKTGIRRLYKKLIPRKTEVAWYVFLPFIATTITFTSFLIGGLPINKLNQILVDNWMWLLLHLMIQTFIIGIGEELGWRGWLLPELLTRHSLAVSMLLVGLIWGAWHLPVFFNGSAVVVPWIMLEIGATILLTWIWLRVNGSVFVLAIAHASINSAQSFLETCLRQGESQLILDSWKVNGYIYLFVSCIFLFQMRKHLTEKKDIKAE